MWTTLPLRIWAVTIPKARASSRPKYHPTRMTTTQTKIAASETGIQTCVVKHIRRVWTTRTANPKARGKATLPRRWMITTRSRRCVRWLQRGLPSGKCYRSRTGSLRLRLRSSTVSLFEVIPLFDAMLGESKKNMSILEQVRKAGEEKGVKRVMKMIKEETAQIANAS